MSRVVFLKMDGESQAEIRTDGDVTWMELTDKFINFLGACGYVVRGSDVAQYLAAEYGLPADEDGPIEWVDPLADITATPYHDLNSVMFQWQK